MRAAYSGVSTAPPTITLQPSPLARSASMVHSIIDLVHALGMHVIAEGVETHRQVEILGSLGLDAIQGYYYCRPLEATRFSQFLENNIFEPRKKAEKKEVYNDPTRR